MKKNFRVITSKSGFTMIEMIWTVAVFAVLTAIAVPSLTTWLPSYNLKSAARDVFSNMQLAKLDAIKRNASCTVTFDTAAHTYTVGGGNPVSLKDYDSHVCFKSPTVGSLTFTSRGMLSDATDRTINITNTQNTATWQITVKRVGNITMTKQ
jgi:prepilin-type N-terminal cleavage/methylation domain-containing protein